METYSFRMAIESFASMYGGDLALQTPMAMQQPYGYTATNQKYGIKPISKSF